MCRSVKVINNMKGFPNPRQYRTREFHKTGFVISLGAAAQWYSQRTSELEVAGSIPTSVIVELL